jgi:prepilin-type N-terminal cleavage/methylation domain-containing protein
LHQTPTRERAGEAGFSLLELLVALGITLVIMSLAASLVSQSVNIRTREDQRSAALADTQSALNMMTREISNSGYGLQSNGIYAAESGSEAITVLSDYDGDNVWDKDEIVSFQLRNNPNTGANSLVRLSLSAAGAAQTTGTVLAESVDTLRVRYFAQRENYETGECDLDNTALAKATTPGKAQYVVFVLCATMPEVGSPGADGYQPASRVQLVSDATLRNSLNLSNTALPKY